MSYTTAPSHQKRILGTKPLGKRWAKIVEDSVMKEGARLARVELKAGRQTTEDAVIVRIPVTIYVSFPRRGKGISPGAGTPQAVCTFSQDEAGSVCKCVGPGAGSCECGDGGGPPVVV